MEITNCSTIYDVRKLTVDDIGMIYELCHKNELFYKYHPPFVTTASIAEDMQALPPNKQLEDKYYLGFFDQQLIAVMDLILDYPQAKTAYIGFFMVDKKAQGKNIGSKIIEDCLNFLKSMGFEKCQLAIDRGNPQSEAFWLKNKFVKMKEERPNAHSAYVSMLRQL